MSWWKKAHRAVKEFWDKELRPTVEPVIRLVVGNKIAKEVEKHSKK